MKSELTKIGDLRRNTANPRECTDGDFQKLVGSLIAFPKMLELRPIVRESDGTVIGGNMRLMALTHISQFSESDLDAEMAKNKDVGKLGRKQREELRNHWLRFIDSPMVPTLNADTLTASERRQFIIKDNASFGRWDWDALANEWDSEELNGWGVNVPKFDFKKYFEEGMKNQHVQNSTDEYDEFVKKFELKKTTDDCYTQQPVYDAVLEFVKENFDIGDAEVVRPFYPGGDYESYHYPKDCVVIDNPPFSILSKIVRFYCDRGIRFFLFGPELTLFIAAEQDLTYIIARCAIVYENGAVVNTGFITNLDSEYRIWCCPQLKDAVDSAQHIEDKTKLGFVHSPYIATSAKLGYITSHATELKIRKSDCEYIRDSDDAKSKGRSLFGGGFILSERAAAERVAAERVAAARAAATNIELSDREKEIVRRLSENSEQRG